MMAQPPFTQIANFPSPSCRTHSSTTKLNMSRFSAAFLCDNVEQEKLEPECSSAGEQVADATARVLSRKEARHVRERWWEHAVQPEGERLRPRQRAVGVPV